MKTITEEKINELQARMDARNMRRETIKGLMHGAAIIALAAGAWEFNPGGGWKTYRADTVEHAAAGMLADLSSGDYRRPYVAKLAQ